jgi:hypothetical protein
VQLLGLLLLLQAHHLHPPSHHPLLLLLQVQVQLLQVLVLQVPQAVLVQMPH